MNHISFIARATGLLLLSLACASGSAAEIGDSLAGRLEALRAARAGRGTTASEAPRLP